MPDRGIYGPPPTGGGSPVGGGSNLDTAGYIPYVSSPGVLSIVKTVGNQIHYNSAQGNYGIGGLGIAGWKLNIVGAFISSGTCRVRSTTDGYIQLAPGGATQTGYIGWHLPNDVRLGTLGFDTVNITLGLENSANFVVTGGRCVFTADVTTPVAVASLPAAPVEGMRCAVNNATAALTAGIGTIVAGGGANHVPVYYDGTNWRIG